MNKQHVFERVVAILSASGVSDPAGEATFIVEAANDRSDVRFEDLAAVMARKRAAGVPLAYAIERARFLGLELLVAPGALVPREETEMLGRAAVAVLRDRESELRLIDMCCGSGNLACAIAKQVPNVRVWATDLTDGAVSVARMNVERLGLADRVTVQQGDLFTSLRGLGLENSIDVVVCNPPYISTSKLDKEKSDMLKYEPREAFDAGPYGVAIFQRVVRDAVEFLTPGGTLLFEIGVGQARQVSLFFDRSKRYAAVVEIKDSSGEPRVVAAEKRPAQLLVNGC